MRCSEDKNSCKLARQMTPNIRDHMNHKILVTLLMLAALCILGEDVQAAALEELNYTLIASKNPLDNEPITFTNLFVLGLTWTELL